MSISVENPIVLSVNNFTPLSRTPWAGRNIAKLFKNDLIKDLGGKAIGESWEFSCDPTFPSILEDGTTSLETLVSNYPNEVLSPKLVERAGPHCEILLKLLNADSPLSLQVHPEDGDDALAPKECGKPESWLVVHAEPGSGLYIGFSQKMSREQLRQALSDGDKAKDMLQFVEVKVGDYFEIEPGMPHAIGPGVTLLEPQRILFGQSGKTYRMWDWGRTYDSQGKEDPKGKPRDLHLEEALRLVDPAKQVGMNFVDSTRRRPNITRVESASIETFPSNPYYQVHTINFPENESHTIDINDGYGVLFAVSGEFKLSGKTETVNLKKGQTVLLPHKSLPAKVVGQGELCLINPAKSEVIFG